MAEIKPRWLFEMAGMSEFRRTSRIGTPAGSASLLVGIDGNYEGGLRPTTGFKSVVDLEYGFGTVDELTVDGGLLAGGTLKDIFGVTFRVKDNTYSYGFVYRVLSDDGTKAVLRLKLRIGQDLTWKSDFDFGFPQGLLGTWEAYAGEQMHVEVFGRFVYVFRSTKEPVLFYLEDDGLGGFNLIVNEDTGPGPAPLLTVPTINSAGATITVGGGRTANEDVTDVLTTMAVPSTGDASGRMLFWGFSGVFNVRSAVLGPDLTNPYINVRNTPSPSQADDNLPGPSGLGLWATPIQPDPLFGSVVWYQNGVPRTPTYSAGAHTEFEGLAYNRSASDDEAPQGFSYPAVWAYRLYDSRTGRFSPLSERVDGIDEIYGRTAFEETVTVTGGQQNSNMAPITFPMLQVIYNKTRYDTLFLYRSRRNTEGLDVDERILSLERQINLADYHIDTQPGNPDWGIAAYFPVLTDGELTQQPIWQDPVSGDFLEDMPKAGSALAYEGVLLFGKMNLLDPSTSGLGKVVWSSLTEINPELVSVNSYYPLYTPDEEVEKFARSGPNVIGFTRLGSYMFRREANYMKGLAMHEGFGIAGPKAAAGVGSDVYYVSESGINILSQNGKMQDLSALNYIIQFEWKDDLADVELAFDQPSSAMFFFNAAKEKAVVAWLRTSRMSELWDMNFEHCFSADIPLDPTVVSRLQRRAAFVQYITPATGDQRWRIYVYDYARTKDVGTFLEPSGGLYYTLASDWEFDTTTIQTVEYLASNIEGCKLYILDGPYTGQSVNIVRRNGNFSMRVEARVVLGTLTAGTRIGISPPFVQWTGAMLGVETAEGLQFSTRDMHSTRLLESLRCAFTDVNAPFVSLETDPKWQGLVYVGTNELPTDARYPTGNARQEVASISNGLSRYAASFSDPLEGLNDPRQGVQSNILFPAVRIFCPGVDYTLLSVRAFGSIRSEDSMWTRE